MSRLRLVVAGPVPPVRSGIADFCGELLPHLAKRADVALLVDAGKVDEAVRGCGVFAVERLGTPAAETLVADADVVLIQLGNDPLHAAAYDLLLDLGHRGRPAVAELHDVVLGHFAAARWFETGRHERYLEEARVGHGEEGERIAREEVLGKRLGLWDLDPWRLPMSGRAIRAAAGVVVHSRFARRKVWKERPEVPCAVVPLFALDPEEFPEKGEARRRIGVAETSLVVTSTGFAVPAKRLDAVVEALATLPPTIDWRFRIAGEPVAGEAVRRRAAELGVNERVVLTGYLSREALLDEMAATDLLANLREPTFGESSASVARILGAGVPVVVSDLGWYGELPDDVVFRIPPGGGAVPALSLLLAEIAVDRSRLASVGAAAARLAREEWSIGRVADLFVAELPRLARGATPGDRLSAAVARAAASLDLSPLPSGVAAAAGAAIDFAVGERR